MTTERGFALLAVMLVLALLGVLAAEFAFSMRLEAAMVRAQKDGILARHLAEAAIQQGIREILTAAPIAALEEDGQVVFHRTAPDRTSPTRVPPLPRQRVALGPGEFSYRITDEEARLNVNRAAPARLALLLESIGLDRQTRDVIVDSVQDWRDANDEHRTNGAESDDYYLRLPVPYRARNGDLPDVRELRQVRGVTDEIYLGTADRPGLAQLVTVAGRNVVNINTAPAPVLRALGLAEAEITDIVQSRARTPYLTVPGRFGGRGLGVDSQVFRIEAEGWRAGERWARIVAIVQRRPSLPAPVPPAEGPRRSGDRGVTVLAWDEGDGL